MTRVRPSLRKVALLKLAILSVAWLALAMPGQAHATSTGTALVIGIDPQSGPAAAAPCAQAGRALRDRLQGQGFSVLAVIDPPLTAMRGAIDDFAAQFDGTVAGPALIYVCAGAITDGSRLFVIPATADAKGMTEPETQSIVAQALLNALAGTGGTLYADLGFPPGAPAAAAIEALGRHLPQGLHLAIAAKGSAAPIGRGLASASVEAGQGWDAVASRLATLPGAATGRLVAYLPVPIATGTAAAFRAPIDLRPGMQTPPAEPSPTPSPDAVAATPGPLPVIRQPHRHAVPHPALQAGGRVARLQAALARLGYYHGPVDGALDEPTLASIRVFQHALGDRETGTLAPAEIVRLLNT